MAGILMLCPPLKISLYIFSVFCLCGTQVFHGMSHSTIIYIHDNDEMEEVQPLDVGCLGNMLE